MSDLIKLIDPTLDVIEKFEHGTSQVYHVISGAEEFVLKIAENTSSELDKYYFLKREAKALKDLQDFDGVVDLVESYPLVQHEGKKYGALLKEFFPGNECNYGGLFNLVCLKDDLRNIIKGLHKRGYAGLDLSHEEIVISPDVDKIKIVDMDQYYHKSECPPLGFQLNKKRDWMEYGTLFF